MHRVIASWYFRQGSGTVHQQAARTTCTQVVFVTQAESTGRRPGQTHHPSGHAHNTGGTP
jgi:hypothetical protein